MKGFLESFELCFLLALSVPYVTDTVAIIILLGVDVPYTELAALLEAGMYELQISIGHGLH